MGRSAQLLALALCLACAIGLLHEAHAEDNPPPRAIIQAPLSEEILGNEWTLNKKRAAADETFTFFVELLTGKEGEVERVAASVSDPDSPHYGRFLSRAELRALVQAPPEVEDQVTEWIQNAVGPDEALDIHSYGDVLKVTTTVGNTEKLFETQISEFTHRATGKTARVISADATIPTEVGDSVRGVVGLCDVSFPKQVSAWHVGRKERRAVDLEKRQSSNISPSNLRTRYNVSSSLMASSSVSQGVVSFNDIYSTTALNYFSTYLGFPTPQVTKVNSAVSGNTPCTSYSCYASAESDLDMQYITGMARNAANIFHLNDNNGYSMYYWALEVANTANPAMVYSISWGAAETTAMGIQYSTLSSSETQFAKVAARGISVFVSSGDAGAAGDSEACPLDVSRYCFGGGCAHTTTSCGQIWVTDSTGSFSFPGTRSGQFQSSTLSSITTWLSQQTGCSGAIEVDNNGLEWLYTTCSCSALRYGTVNSVTIQNYNTATANYIKFRNSYPATSAWVTAVGATEWDSRGTFIHASSGVETTGSADGLSSITSGGGFSAVISQPSWQSSFVQSYLSSATGLPSSSTYSSTKRGYPDISLLGHNYLVRYAGSSGQDSAYWILADGTSASSPALAGLVTLINKMRIDSGKSQLGFLNPMLYKMKTDRPNAFTDVKTGSNKATMGYVCQLGFAAIDGWDPATGLGVPNFGNFAQYLLNYDTQSPSPTSSPIAASSRSPTLSVSASASPTTSASQTPTASFSPSRTATPTRTPSASATSSATPSRSVTPSSSASPSRSATPSSSRTPTRSPTSSSTRTPSPSPTSSLTRTPSPSTTPSSSSTPSPSTTPSSSSTPTPSPSRSPTRSPSASRTPTPSRSTTPSNSKTASPTRSPTRSPSASRSPTRSVTPTRSPSKAPSSSRTPSSSPTRGLTPI